MIRTETIAEAFSCDVARRVADWFETWSLPGLDDEVTVRFSRRMTRSVGRCYPERRLLSLTAAVREMAPAAVFDILAHELAHLAAWEHFGRGARPHGREWQALVRAIGFRPAVSFDDAQALALMRAQAPPRTRYLHVCPACHAQRVAGRRMPAWRCGACYEIGRDGRLVIVPVES
ncbi:MAG: SprT-like domain-containing protein [Gammaproteobacteria bacterium]